MTVKFEPGLAKDSVQLDKRNEADMFITGWWIPKTSLDKGIQKVFDSMAPDLIEDLTETCGYSPSSATNILRHSIKLNPKTGREKE